MVGTPRRDKLVKSLYKEFAKEFDRGHAQALSNAFGDLDGAFSPGADYTAGQSDRYLPRPRGIRFLGSGHDYHIRTDVRWYLMLERARSFDRNNMVIAQAVDRLRSFIIGEGFMLDVDTGDKRLDRDLEARWNAWASDPQQCDFERENTFYEMEKLAFRHQVVDGDLVSLPINDGSLQLAEAHRLRSPAGNREGVVHGVELDNRRRRVAYWLTPEDRSPYEYHIGSADLRRYPTYDADGNRQVFHHYQLRRKRSSQTRGVTAMAPMVVPVQYHDDLQFCAMVKAKVASFYAIIREYSDGPPQPNNAQRGSQYQQSRQDGSTQTVVGGSPGQEIRADEGESIKGFAPNIPNPEFFPHATMILTFIAINLDIPVAVLLLDPKLAGNFSSWRGAVEQARERHREMQKTMYQTFHEPVYRMKVRQWMEEDPALARAAMRRKTNDIFRHRWQPPAWPYIEPVKDVTADDLEKTRNLNSPRRIAQRRGRDYEKLTTEIIDDRGLLVEKAIVKAAELNEQYDAGITWQELAYGANSKTITVSEQVETAEATRAPDNGGDNEDQA